MFDLRFRNPSSFLLAGSSQCGKTTFTINLLKNVSSLFEDPRCRQNILYFYKEWQKSYEDFKKEKIVREWINKVPTIQDVKEKTKSYKHCGGSIIIIDDFAQQLNKEVAEMFTVHCHHTNSVLILLTQNLFSKNPVFRDISLNATYVVMFKNPRDASQISMFAKQFSPGKNNYIVPAFREATINPYSYVLFDHYQGTPDFLRIRSRIFPFEAPMCVWMDGKEKEIENYEDVNVFKK